MWLRQAGRWNTSYLFPSVVSFSSCPLRSCTRYVSQERRFRVACEGLPTTPSGRNPYEVLDLPLSTSLTKQDISKQYRDLVVQCHPDKPGGSTERMTEVNLAYKILKEHHDSVLRQLQQIETAQQELSNTRNRFGKGEKDGGSVSSTEEFPRRARRQSPFHSYASTTGSSSSTAAPRRPHRSLQEIVSQWEMLTKETESAVRSICSRYEVALQQGKFLRDGYALNEITARERWIRKSFIKSMWETIHELRGELLHRGARSAQQSELAENMVVLASQMQRKLNEDFQRQTQSSIQYQARMLVERALMILFCLVGLIRLWNWALSDRKYRSSAKEVELM